MSLKTGVTQKQIIQVQTAEYLSPRDQQKRQLHTYRTSICPPKKWRVVEADSTHVPYSSRRHRYCWEMNRVSCRSLGAAGRPTTKWKGVGYCCYIEVYNKDTRSRALLWRYQRGGHFDRKLPHVSMFPSHTSCAVQPRVMPRKEFYSFEQRSDLRAGSTLVVQYTVYCG